MTAPLRNQLVLAPETLVKFKGQEIMLFTNRTYTKHQDIHDQESFRKSDSFIPHSRVQSNIVWSRLSRLWCGNHQRENTGSRLFTEIYKEA